MKKWKEDPFWGLFLEKKYILLSFWILLLNFFAALLEGASFGGILLAFSCIQKGSFEGSESTFLKFFSFPWQKFSPKILFVGFIGTSIVLQAVRSGMNYFAQYLTSFLSLGVQKEAQGRVYKQIFRFSFSFVNRYKAGDLVKYAQEPATAIPFLLDGINRLIVSSSMVLVAVGMMFFLNFPLTLLAFFLFFLFIFFQRTIIGKIAGVSAKLATEMSHFSQHAVQSLYGMRLIHTFHRQKEVFRKVTDILQEIVQGSRKINLWNNAIPAIHEIVGVLLVGVLLVAGTYFLKKQDPNFFPALMTFIVVTYRLSTKLRVSMESIGTIAYYYGSLVRLKGILSEEGKEFVSDKGEKVSFFEKEIEFKNVSLNYGKGGKNSLAIQNISFVLPKGKTVALVGSSGAGKSTLVDLLLRLYTPTEGEIFIDGKKLRNFELASWRERLGVVSQETFLFNETIEENLRFGKVDATKAEIIEAAKLAHAHEFISQLSEGYQTVVGEKGVFLSGGEKQRISLARVFLKNPEILILDEATSNLDSLSEKLIQDSLEKVFQKKKTILLIAHRLSTVLKADHILVLEKGSLVEQGTHKTLLEKKGFYFWFWKMQSEHPSEV